MKNICSLIKKDKIISFICRNEYKYFLNKKNVVGVGLGFKIKNGINTYSKCIKVFVKKKCSQNRLFKKDLIPLRYKGISTDVIESGIFKSSSLTNKVRPVIGGYSIGSIKLTTYGSLGCLVCDSNNTTYLLTNNHVVCRNSLPLKTPITQPGESEKENIIGILSKYVPIKYITFLRSPTNYVDCAICKLITPSIGSSKIAFIGNIEGTIIPVLNTPVKKVGATSELTTGTITDIYVTMIMTFINGKKALFEDQIFTTNMIFDGDSGSILLNENNYAVGLAMGASKSSSVYNNISNVLKSLNVRILSY